MELGTESKKAYSTPHLTVWGTVEEITAIKPVGEFDNQGGIS